MGGARCSSGPEGSATGVRPERCDGVDDDCDGSDLTDVDGDGYDWDGITGGTDCDDTDAAINPGASETFLRCAVALGEDEALDLAQQFGRHHPSGRMRLACFEARAARMADDNHRDALWREAEAAGNLMVAQEARQQRAALEP